MLTLLVHLYKASNSIFRGKAVQVFQARPATHQVPLVKGRCGRDNKMV
jgi:hypothetical protein